jgi:ABC-type Fe3+-siderophore transport system permease subunit
MGSMEIRAGARDSALAGAMFAAAAMTALVVAAFGPTLIESPRLLGAVLFLLSLSLLCAEGGRRSSRYWLIGASVSFALAVILGALAPLR